MDVVEVPVGDSGQVVQVEVRRTESGSPAPVGRGGQTVRRAAQSLEEMLDTVRPVAESFVGSLGAMERPPESVTVEFGVSLSAQADLRIASTSTAANFSVSLTWNGENSDNGDHGNGGDNADSNDDGVPAGSPPSAG